MPMRDLFIAMRILPQTRADSSIRTGAGVHRGVEKLTAVLRKEQNVTPG
jgi:hypothetical protein